jgi:hypothetical protein
MAAQLYGEFLEALYKGVHNFSSHSFRMILCTSDYSPDADTDSLLTDITNEVVGTGYSTGGKVVTINSVVYDAVSHKLIITANNIQWAMSSITARYAVLYNYTVSSKPLVGYFDFGEDKTSNNSMFELDIASEGLINQPI